MSQSVPIAQPSKIGQHATATSFQSDTNMILKKGWLYKKTRHKTWTRRWFLLRKEHLVYYKDDQEYRAEDIIPVNDIMTAVVIQEKSMRLMVCTLKKNIHLRAESQESAIEWASTIKKTVDESCEDIETSSFTRISEDKHRDTIIDSVDNAGTSNSGIAEEKIAGHAGIGVKNAIGPEIPTQGFHSLEFSGASDMGMSSATSDHQFSSDFEKGVQSSSPQKNAKDDANKEDEPQSTDNVIMQGYLMSLKRRIGNWHRQWLQLTDDYLYIYKVNGSNCELSKSLRLPDIMDVVEVQGISSSKQHCFQVITAQKRIRYCAYNEHDLMNWLAAFKSVKESDR